MVAGLLPTPPGGALIPRIQRRHFKRLLIPRQRLLLFLTWELPGLFAQSSCEDDRKSFLNRELSCWPKRESSAGPATAYYPSWVSRIWFCAGTVRYCECTSRITRPSPTKRENGEWALRFADVRTC